MFLETKCLSFRVSLVVLKRSRTYYTDILFQVSRSHILKQKEITLEIHNKLEEKVFRYNDFQILKYFLPAIFNLLYIFYEIWHSKWNTMYIILY